MLFRRLRFLLHAVCLLMLYGSSFEELGFTCLLLSSYLIHFYLCNLENNVYVLPFWLKQLYVILEISFVPCLLIPIAEHPVFPLERGVTELVSEPLAHRELGGFLNEHLDYGLRFKKRKFSENYLCIAYFK